MKILKVFIYTTVLIVTTHYEPLQRNLKRIESVGFFPNFLHGRNVPVRDWFGFLHPAEPADATLAGVIPAGGETERRFSIPRPPPGWGLGVILWNLYLVKIVHIKYPSFIPVFPL